jgi:hypothetical protein
MRDTVKMPILTRVKIITNSNKFMSSVKVPFIMSLLNFMRDPVPGTDFNVCKKLNEI